MRQSLELGVFLHTRHLIREDGGAPSFEEVWADAIQAEEIGYDHVWLGDSVTMLDKARGDCLTTMAALAAKTKKVRIGTVPLLPTLRNPVLLAHALATLDVISQGRIIIAASVAPLADYIERQFIACGVPFREKAGRLSESIQVMRRLWTEKSLAFEGRYYRFKEVGIPPTPIQKPTIPIWIAAGNKEQALKRVARLGDGWFITADTLDEFIACRRKIDAYAEEFGRSKEVSGSALYASFNVKRDGNLARVQGWSWMEDFFRQPRSKLKHHFTIFGTPEECVQTLQRYLDAGLTMIVARLAAPNQREQMRWFLEELKPRLPRRVET